jgi:hypothetical protein
MRELTVDALLAIFIDDLDRCRSETALSVLEALRVHRRRALPVHPRD